MSAGKKNVNLVIQRWILVIRQQENFEPSIIKQQDSKKSVLEHEGEEGDGV